MGLLRTLVTIFFCLSLTGSVVAQVQEFSVEYLTIDKGLPQNEVTSIIQDKKGFIWLGTRGGLARYDGYNVKVFQYEPGNKNSLSNNSIEALFESSDGKIWIGTKSGGLNCFDPSTETFEIFHFHASDKTSISGDRVVSIAETADGTIWAGTWENGLNSLDRRTGKFSRFLQHTHVLAIKSDSAGNLWIAADSVVYRWDAKSFSITNAGLNLGRQVQLTALALDEKRSIIFVSGWEAGLVEFDYKNKKIVKRHFDDGSMASKKSNNLYSLLLDSNKKVWMGFWGDGLKFLDSGNPTTKVSIGPVQEGKYNTDYDIVLTIFQDRAGNIWAGTDGGGVCKLMKRNNLFKSFTYGNTGLSSGHVLSIKEDSNGRIWIGTKGGGLNELRGDKIIYHAELFEKIRDIKINDIHTIYCDFNDDLWFGSNYGLHKVTGEKNGKLEFDTYTRNYNRKNSLSDEKVMAILRDSNSRLWVGTQQQGLNRLMQIDGSNNAEFKGYKFDPQNPFSLADNRISVLFEDSKKRLWVGTYKGIHLYRDDIDGFINLHHQTGNREGLSNDIITCIAEDLLGNIWVGTAGGLNKVVVENGALRATYQTKKDGLPNDYVNAILPDSSNNLWISSNGGIFRLNTVKGHIHYFNVRDGLQSNAYSENAACESKSGLMYFGGINGFDVFNPASKYVSKSSPLSFVSLMIMNKEVSPGEVVNDNIILRKSISYTKEVTLTHLDKVISIEVSSLDFTLPEKNQYAFKLEGFDEDWQNFQDRRIITYTTLKPGSYVLNVKSSDFGNVWVGQPISLRINVLPPPWKTWWAYMIYISILTAVVYVIYYFRRRQLLLEYELKDATMNSEKAEFEKRKEKEMSDMKMLFFTNVSHELKTPLTLIISPVEELLTVKEIPKGFREKLLLIHRHSGRLLTLVHQLLDLRKSETGNMKLVMEQRDIVKFVYEVFESFIHLAEKRHVNYLFQSDLNHLLLDFDQNKIEMAVTNILSNAFKYTSDNGKITCQISIEKDAKSDKTYCEISVIDTGSGMPKEVQDKIFDLYYQVAVVDSVKISGTGIGLALVKEIIQLHGGVVSVNSSEGKGSTFTMKLPVKQVLSNLNNLTRAVDLEVVSNENAVQKAELQDLDKPILLIIEDTDELRDYIAQLLHDEFHVIQTVSGEEGLKVALEKIPDIIVSDVMMAGMDGFELCNKVKNNEKTCHIPVILLTAKIMPENELSGLVAGADDYIKKPFNPTILVARIRRLLDSRKVLKDYYSKKVTLQPTNIEITPYDEKFLNKAMSYIEANLLNPDLSAESLGYELGMSHSSLYRKLKALTGQSINGFMRSIRLKRAAQLLATKEFTISEVAFQTGFSEVKYFRMNFKEQFGCLPSEYLKSENEVSS